jgi:plasmid stabilization system protein ParE
MVVEWLAEAENDLKEIFDYYLAEAGRDTAKKITDRIRVSAEQLGEMPLSASVELLLEGRPEGFRSMVVKRNHKVVYFVGNDKVNIVTVFDCRRNPVVLREKVTERKS